MGEVDTNNTKTDVKDINKVLGLFGKLDDKKKELALAALTGMVLAVEADKKVNDDDTI